MPKNDQAEIAPEPKTAHAEIASFRKLEKLLKKFLESVPKLGERPAFPAIKEPNSGAVINASQTTTTALHVTVSTNRPDLTHYVDLLDADSFATLDSVTQAAPTGSPFAVTLTIPQLTDAGPRTLMLQCRAPASLAGNVHRILIDVRDPVPKVAQQATSGGVALPPGDYPSTDVRLGNVTVTATATGVDPFTYHWTTTRVDAALGITTTTATTTTPTVSLDNLDLIAGAAVFPIAVSFDVYVTDADGHNSATAPTLTFRITP